MQPIKKKHLRISQSKQRQTFNVYLQIAMYMEANENVRKCRCCTQPSGNFVKLAAKAKLLDASEKTFQNLLDEITSGAKSPPSAELFLPHEVCGKCVKQLQSCYHFLLQIQQTYEFYLRRNAEEDIKCFQEVLIELPERESMLSEIPDGILNYNCDDIDPVCEQLEVKLEEEDLLPQESIRSFADKDEEERSHTASPDCFSCESEDAESLSSTEFDLNEPIARRCDVCHKVYRDERALNIHKHFTHMPEEKKMPCPFCSYKTSRPSALKVHIGAIHGTDKVAAHVKRPKKFPCTLCSRGYQRRDDLRKHLRLKHINPQKSLKLKSNKESKPKLEESYLCPHCGQSYRSKKGLDGHLLSHTGERPHQCDLCDKTFKRIKDMKAHRVIHSDEKPFQCSQCGKSFKRADKLKIHMRVHSEVRPYKCKECEKTFKYPSVLRTHMHMHTGQTPFSCKTCGEAFSLRTSLNNHCQKNGHVK